jgi:predicted DNA-binding protein (MmcQ/YjbR family)
LLFYGLFPTFAAAIRDDTLICEFIDHSHEEVYTKIPHKAKAAYEEQR